MNSYQREQHRREFEKSAKRGCKGASCALKGLGINTASYTSKEQFFAEMAANRIDPSSETFILAFNGLRRDRPDLFQSAPPPIH